MKRSRSLIIVVGIVILVVVWWILTPAPSVVEKSSAPASLVTPAERRGEPAGYREELRLRDTRVAEPVAESRPVEKPPPPAPSDPGPAAGTPGRQAQ